MVYSASSVYSLEHHSTTNYYLIRHSIYLAIGLAFMLFLMRVDYSALGRLVYPAYLLGLLMLIIVLVPGIGKEVNGARRWIDLGFITFQPSEMAKYVLILYLAHSLTKKKDKINNFVMGFASHVLIAGVYIGLILLQPDFGSAAVLTVIVFAVLFVGRVRLRHLILIVVASVALMCVAVVTQSYRMERISAFLDPWQDSLGSGYQVVQSFVAFGSGGIYGVGLGESAQKLFFLPHAHTDFIFSIIGEELGFIGVAVIITVFAVMFIQSLRVSLRAPDLFGCYLAFGCALLITLQAAVNMSVTVGIVPPTGITLPFVSYGGTSLVASLSAVGMILSVSKRQR